MRFYSLRFSLLPSLNFEERMEKLLDFCEKACIDDVMFFIAPEEVNTGHTTLAEAKRYADVILRAKNILKDRGIKISLNPWCTLSHWDGGRPLKEGQNFRTMVGSDGTVAQRVACPLCQNWRDYYVELISFYAKTLEPQIMWFEDDMRYSNHDPVWLGCFCSEHMARFNAALGSDYDRETFIKKIFTDNKVRKAYLDVMGESIRETIEYIVSRVPEQNAFGLMTGGAGQGEGRKYREIFATMTDGGKHPKPYNRICLHSYRQRGLQANAWSINEGSMFSRKVTGNRAECVSEMENFPHSMYTKSANYLRYQLLSTAPMGLKGDTFSIFEFNGNGAVNYEKYARVLKKVKPYLNRLVKLDFTPEDMIGVQVLFSENSAYNIKADKGTFGELNPYDSWIFAYLEQIGVACSFTNDVGAPNRIVAMSGQTARNYTPQQLERLFTNNYVVLTGDNVEALCDMGLGHLIGVESFEIMPELDGKHAMEEINSDDEIFEVKQMRATAQFFCGSYYNIKYTDQNRTVFTKMLNYDETVVGDGITQVGNALIIPYKNTRSDQQVPISLLCPLREYVIKKALLNNPYGVEKLYCVDEENVCIYVFDKGEKVYIVCMNFIDDNYDRLHLDMPYVFDNIKFFTPDNDEVRQASYVYENGRYSIRNQLKAQESYVLIGYKAKQKNGL